MNNENALEILKQAILLEKRGHAFYSTAASQAKDADIAKIFLIMADEETEHVKYLSEQYVNIKKNNAFEKMDLPDLPDTLTKAVMSEDIKSKISSAGFEAAAISAAIDFEKRAIEVYSKQALEATDPNEKELFEWLAGWEKTHLKVLTDLDNELKEKIWFDNQFWPF
jgi:rubrerythrin